MPQYILRRILIAIPVLIGVTMLCFLIINLAPGDPVDMMMDPSTPPEMAEATREKLGLNKPIHVRYFIWLSGLLRGDLGYSYKTYRPVSEMIAERIPSTVLLMGVSMLLGILVALPLGIVCALRQNSLLDYAAGSMSLAGVSVPSFFLGLVLIYVFSLRLGWFPSSGTQTMGAQASVADRIWHLALPALVLSGNTAGQLTRYVRSSMLEAFSRDYLRTARAKGLGEMLVVGRHALRNSLIPVCTIIGLEIPQLFGGAIVTEQLFSWPGMGQLAVGAILGRDYPVLMAINLISAVLVISCAILTDVVYCALDPRIKLA